MRDVSIDRGARPGPVVGRHQDLVVPGVAMADLGDYGESDGIRFKLLGRSRSADATGIFSASVRGDLCRLAGGTTGELLANRLGEAGHVLFVEFLTARRGLVPLADPEISIGQGFFLGAADRRWFGENSLALVMLAGARPLQHHGSQRRMLGSPSGNGRIASRQILQMIEIGTLKTKRPVVFQS